MKIKKQRSSNVCAHCPDCPVGEESTVLKSKGEGLQGRHPAAGAEPRSTAVSAGGV